MITLTVGQIIFSIIMIWAAGFALGATAIVRIAHKIQDEENTRDTIRNLNEK